jgi:hypothetical protein
MNGLRYGIFNEVEVRGRSQGIETEMFHNVIAQSVLAEELGWESYCFLSSIR